VLAPLHMQELVYRLLQREQGGKLIRLALAQERSNPVAAALEYIETHLAETMTVEDLAEQLNLSPSAFSRMFRETTGRPPYQYVKEVRLDRARALLDERRLAVADVSRAVGYVSVSHFIKAFRARFHMTPGEYADANAPRARVHALYAAAGPPLHG